MDMQALAQTIAPTQGAKRIFNINKVDFQWVANQTSVKELKAAMHALEEDGGFDHLLQAVIKRLKEVDTSFKTAADYNNYTFEEEKKANEDVLAFLDEMAANDRKIKEEVSASAGNQNNQAIFDDETQANSQTEVKSQFISSLENKRIAEDARNSGNDCMKAKEYDEAINMYSRAI